MDFKTNNLVWDSNVFNWDNSGCLYWVREFRMKCIFCRKVIDGWGNNALPLKKGRCCDKCNSIKVIPARIARCVSYSGDNKNAKRDL